MPKVTWAGTLYPFIGLLKSANSKIFVVLAALKNLENTYRGRLFFVNQTTARLFCQYIKLSMNLITMIINERMKQESAIYPNGEYAIPSGDIPSLTQEIIERERKAKMSPPIINKTPIPIWRGAFFPNKQPTALSKKHWSMMIRATFGLKWKE